MMPSVGETCKFTFTTKFAILNGIYVVQAETTFTGAIESGVNFVDSLYTPAGLKQSDFSADFQSYSRDRVAILQSVTDASVVIQVPESVFATVPDPTIKAYLPLTLVVELGVQENTQAVLPLLDFVKDMVTSVLGSKDAVRVFTNTQKTVFLTDTEYDAIKAVRAALSKQLVPLTQQVKTLQDANTYLAAKVAAYETALVQTTQHTS